MRHIFSVLFKAQAIEFKIELNFLCTPSINKCVSAASVKTFLHRSYVKQCTSPRRCQSGKHNPGTGYRPDHCSSAWIWPKLDVVCTLEWARVRFSMRPYFIQGFRQSLSRLFDLTICVYSPCVSTFCTLSRSHCWTELIRVCDHTRHPTDSGLGEIQLTRSIKQSNIFCGQLGVDEL